jgi:hypothetical protein
MAKGEIVGVLDRAEANPHILLEMALGHGRRPENPK